MEEEGCSLDVSCASWGVWGGFGGCSVRCGGGLRSRKRVCAGAEKNPAACGSISDAVESLPCNQEPCKG